MTRTIITAAAYGPGSIRARRQAAGLTQRQLATAARCSLTWLANIEAGCIPTRSEAMARIHDALDAVEHDRAASDAPDEQRPGGDRGATSGSSGSDARNAAEAA